MLIRTRFRNSFPAMSAYEFDHFRREPEVHERWKESCLYMICQRPVLYFSEYVPGADEIVCKIKQRGNEQSLSVRLPILPGKPYFGATASVLVEAQFYDDSPRIEPPYDNVAGFKFFDENENFSGWLSPERFLFGYLRGHIEADVEGDIDAMLQYQVHYIGKAQDQPIWKRLRAHESFQSVLSREFPFITGEIPTFEIALLFFELEGITVFPGLELRDGEPVGEDGKSLTEEQVEELLGKDYISTYERAIVTDAEAYFINFMLPRYNRVRYMEYPDIKGGLKEKGFDATDHLLIVLATLFTEEATYSGTLK